MNNFLFITHVTPPQFRSSLRQELFELYQRALKQQIYPNWKVILFAEEEKRDGNFVYVNLDRKEKGDGLPKINSLLQRKDIKEIIDWCDYVIRLDDDDLISSSTLQQLSVERFDCCYDEHHTFFEITSGQITQQKRPWMASTCVQKKEHAFSLYNGPGASVVGNLLYSDHSQSWHNYYKEKKNIIASPSQPVYMRVLSPTSVTASASGNRIYGYKDVSFEKYQHYLSSFGDWKQEKIKGFEEFSEPLANAWKNFSGKETSPLQPLKKSFKEKIVRKIKNYGKGN